MPRAAVVAAALLATLLALALGAAAYNGRPAPGAVVRPSAYVRVTVLTSRMLRLEYSASGAFVDEPTWMAVERALTPVPQYAVAFDAAHSTVVIKTEALVARFRNDSAASFSALNVEITTAGGATWTPGPDSDHAGNLFGTLRTLDGDDGALNLDCASLAENSQHCVYGVASRAGYVVLDDTHMPRYSDETRPWIENVTYAAPPSADCKAVSPSQRRPCAGFGASQQQCALAGCCWDDSASRKKHAQSDPVPSCFYGEHSDQDLYFLGYDNDYRGAIADYTRLSDPVALPPRYAFGVFFSRYWAYDAVGQMDIVQHYDDLSIPLDNLVTDMDWHLTFYAEAARGEKDQAGQTIGWTGFTWDPSLFPNPEGFLAWCKRRGLHNTVNIHPASGMQPWEDKYAAMATAMGQDPAKKIYVPFQPDSEQFVTNWESLVLDPLMQQGIDFFWLDWQQGEDWVARPNFNPTFWLNYMFFTAPHWAVNDRRPLILHRWGGLGNHRFQVGFSGDTVPDWSTLKFQTYFTATAANVGFGWWSHDLGGHVRPSPPELYTRWVQFGAFSPMFRTHCTKNADNTRDIWKYPPQNFEIMRSAMRLRLQMVPYIYTAARRAHDTGLSLVLPLYYEFPENDESYSFANEYFFGDSMVVAPVVSPMDPATNLTAHSFWVPPGCWVDWFSGQVFNGPLAVNASLMLDEIPVLMRCDAIVPLNEAEPKSVLGQAQLIPSHLVLHVPMGATQARGAVYEDDGVSNRFSTHGESATTQFSMYSMSATSGSVTLYEIEGHFNGAPTERSFEIRLQNVPPAAAGSVRMNGTVLPWVPERPSSSSTGGWTYDGTTATLVIFTPKISTIAATGVSYQFTSTRTDPVFTMGVARLLKRAQQIKQLLDDQWGIDTVYQENYTSLIKLAEASEVMSLEPESADQVLLSLRALAVQANSEISALTTLDPAVKTMALAWLQPYVTA